MAACGSGLELVGAEGDDDDDDNNNNDNNNDDDDDDNKATIAAVRGNGSWRRVKVIPVESIIRSSTSLRVFRSG